MARMKNMKTEEIEELLRLKRWSKRKLAEELALTEDAVYRWFVAKDPSTPNPSACLLMRFWLNEARKGTPMPAASA